MKRVGIAAILVGAAFFLYVYTQPAYTHRFRLTVEIQTPEGIRSGSSVIETRAWESGNWGPIEARGIRRDFRGRALFVDLGSGRNLIALLGFGPEAAEQYKLFRLVSDALAPGTELDWEKEFQLRGRGVLPNNDIPALVTFRNLNDPASAIRVDPFDMREAFGPGFAFRQVLLQTTDDAPSDNIGNLLPWWNMPGRPAEKAYRAWRQGSTVGESLVPEYLFQKE